MIHIFKTFVTVADMRAPAEPFVISGLTIIAALALTVTVVVGGIMLVRHFRTREGTHKHK